MAPANFQTNFESNRQFLLSKSHFHLFFSIFQVEDLSNKIAEYFHQKNYQKKDTIALFMENRPEYPCFWLGLSKLGVISALINTNLRKETLIHSIKIANCKAVIVSPDYWDGEFLFVQILAPIFNLSTFSAPRNFPRRGDQKASNLRLQKQ